MQESARCAMGLPEGWAGMLYSLNFVLKGLRSAIG
jgi:hypothetical protein